MDGRSKNNIESILEAYGKQQEAVRRETERRRVEREAFLLEFQRKVASVIRPVMEQVGELLVRSGHEFEILEKEAAAQGRRAANAVVTLVIFPEGERPRTEEPVGWPHVALLAHPSKNTVLVYESAMMPNVGGPAGTAAEYALESISPDIVEKHIVSVLSRAMGIGRTRKTPSLRIPRRHNPHSAVPRTATAEDPSLFPSSATGEERSVVPRTATGEDRIDAAFDYLATLGAPRSEEINPF